MLVSYLYPTGSSVSSFTYAIYSFTCMMLLLLVYTVIGQFGHCNQDLLNLLLTGRATSNVLDGEMALGDSGLKLRGVYQRNAVGYLTQLEALRYCEVP